MHDLILRILFFTLGAIFAAGSFLTFVKAKNEKKANHDYVANLVMATVFCVCMWLCFVVAFI
jgi:hypothetical protein